jgi:hypothetical protein
MGPNVSLSSLKEVEMDLQHALKRNNDSTFDVVVDPPARRRDAMNIAITLLFPI